MLSTVEDIHVTRSNNTLWKIVIGMIIHLLKSEQPIKYSCDLIKLKKNKRLSENKIYISYAVYNGLMETSNN